MVKAKQTLTSLISAGALVLAQNTFSQEIAKNSKEISSLAPKNAFVRASWHSRYMGTFGFTLSDGPVTQNDLGFDIGKVSYNLWTNYDFDKGNGKGLNEIDNSLVATFQTKHLTIQPDFYWYTFPGVDFPDAFTFGLAVSTRNLPLDLKLYGTKSYGSSEGSLAQLSIGKSFQLNKRVSFNLNSALTYNNSYFVHGSGFTVVSAGANVNINLGKGYSLNTGIRSQKALESLGGTFKDHAAIFDFSLKKSF